MNQKRLIQVLIGAVVVLVVVLIMDVVDNIANRGVIKELQKELDTEKKESKKRVDSIKTSIKDEELVYIKKIRILEAQKDSIRGLYEHTKQEMETIENDISLYLSFPDSIRFARFKVFLTRMD